MPEFVLILVNYNFIIMKKFIVACFLALSATSIFAKDIEELVVTTNPPMSCQNCENKIKGNLRFEKGVKEITTNLKEQKVTIKYDADKTDAQNIEEAFKKIGYNVTVLSPSSDAEENNIAPTPASENPES